MKQSKNKEMRPYKSPKQPFDEWYDKVLKVLRYHKYTGQIPPDMAHGPKHAGTNEKCKN